MANVILHTSLAPQSCYSSHKKNQTFYKIYVLVIIFVLPCTQSAAFILRHPEAVFAVLLQQGSDSPFKNVCFTCATPFRHMFFEVGREAEGIVGVVVVRTAVRVDIAEIVRVARISRTQPPIDGVTQSHTFLIRQLNTHFPCQS